VDKEVAELQAAERAEETEQLQVGVCGCPGVIAVRRLTPNTAAHGTFMLSWGRAVLPSEAQLEPLTPPPLPDPRARDLVRRRKWRH